jgi:hypothetical protein
MESYTIKKSFIEVNAELINSNSIDYLSSIGKQLIDLLSDNNYDSIKGYRWVCVHVA